ncbi:DUF4157 domain-containing protein [Planktothrix agardhii 1806]|uniref:eCIS core domain-containing protein n=1 Tax=Planktothrix agardhii TaxID=1160 RepID=UPI001F1B27B4|nr:DUF4157 domain-containing protein [Planktothrix agardhii]MCF3586095.1 DUF4157 domain-containing protein [Planktothrix agardhii 1803]MCF3602923.1 DUF4157 domain-containing protein [Planktothrix agardhii 1804]MCF3616167.1 DUF4157 domain-containing protein [Planktothrix agardhii 1806]
MKAFQRKRNIQNTHHDIQPVQAQFQSRPFAEPQAETKSVSENTSSLQSGNSKPGFNFAEILLYPTQPQVTAPVQPKFTFAQAKLESGIVQREEQEEEPQAKLESGIVQRSDEEDEPQAKLESGMVQRSEEEEPQAKLESGMVQRSEEEEEPAQMKAQSLPVISENKGLQSNRQFPPMQVKLNLAPRDSVQSLPIPVQRKMEWAFNTDFSGVRVHTGPQAKQIQAKAFTQGSDIHFQPDQYNPHSQQGQELLGHELTHVVQQRAGRVNKKPQSKGNRINFDYQLEAEADNLGAKASQGEQVEVLGAKNLPKLYSSQTIQRKTQDITPLDDKIVNKGWIGKNRTQVIQNKIREYNAILKEDKDYKTQQKILNRIDHKTRKWLEQHKDDKRAPRLSQLLTEVVKEGTEVKIQKAKSSQGYVDKLKQNVVGDKAVEGINAGATAYGAVKASGALTPDNQMTFGQQTKSLVEGVNESVNQGSNLTSTEKIANLSQNYADIVKASPVAALGGSVVSLLMSIYNLVDSYSILSALGSSAKNLGVLKEVENTEPEQEKDSLVLAYEALEINRSGKSTDNNQELQKSTKYGYAKVKRRFFGAIYDVISNIVNIVGQILTVTGVGALVGAIISTGTKVIDLVTLTIRKIKGLYKILTGKRGVKRQLSAETIVQDALNGNGEALNLLVKLDPLGVAGRRIVGILKVKDLKGIKKPETQDQMKEFLIQIKKGKLGSITLSDFITAVAEQLKSF